VQGGRMLRRSFMASSPLETRVDQSLR
jgi:hypothetical protein